MTHQLPFTPRLPPLHYQADYLRDHGHAPAWGLLWDPGTGKTKGLIDNTALLVHDDLIDGALILAPNGVHRVWQTDELPKHWPHPPTPECDAFLWDTARASGKRYQEDFRRWLGYTRAPDNPRGPVPFLLMSYDGLMTDAGKQASWEFIRKRRVMLIGDESQRFKAPISTSNPRSYRVFAISAYAAYRRIASGTPGDKPFDLYSQMRFLAEDFWVTRMGISGFSAFKAHLGNWYKAKMNNGVYVDMLNSKNPYKNLDELAGVLSGITTRVTEEAAELDLPPRLYRRIVHDLSAEQQRVYEELKTECLSVLSSGELVTTDHVLTMRLRLMQIGCGFVTPSAGSRPVCFGENPRADAYADLLTAIGPSEPTLTWCQFVQDARTTEEVSRSLGRRPVVYSADDPVHTLDAWKAGDADDLIANLGSGLTEGQTLVRTAHIPYFSNTPRLITRQQSEKRAHRIGQTRSPTYYDFLARGTNDTANLEAVRGKAGWMGLAMGDDPGRAAAWLRATLSGETPPPAADEPGLFDRDTDPSPEAYEAWFSERA
jgi:hypothetical protein